MLCNFSLRGYTMNLDLDNEILNIIQNTNCNENIKKFLIEIFYIELQMKEYGSLDYKKKYEKILSYYIE